MTQDRDKQPETRIIPAQNGGYVVERGSGDSRVMPNLIGAYTTATDLIEAMPEILGTDGIEAVVRKSTVTLRAEDFIHPDSTHLASQIPTTQKDQTNG